MRTYIHCTNCHQAYSLRWQPVQAWKVPGTHDFILSHMISCLDVTMMYMISYATKYIRFQTNEVICLWYDILEVGTLTSHIQTYDIICITSYPISNVYHIICWNYDIIFTNLWYQIYDFIPYIICLWKQVLEPWYLNSAIWFHMYDILSYIICIWYHRWTQMVSCIWYHS